MEHGLGYRQDLEDQANLAATAKPFQLQQTYAAPRTICHRGWKRNKDQDGIGSCTGGSRANGEEVLNYIATGGQVVTLSMMYAYLENQRACGLLGQDQGATIDGSCRAALETGICLEATFPFPARYTTEIPPAAETEGKLHLIRSHAVMRSYDDILAWIASGVGVVLIGIPWVTGLINAGPRIEYRDAKGHSVGGHALALEGYGGPDADAPVLDSQGRPYIDMENTHTEQWADRGWSLVAPEAITYWIEQRNTLIGISDLEAFAPRPIKTWTGMWK